MAYLPTLGIRLADILSPAELTFEIWSVRSYLLLLGSVVSRCNVAYGWLPTVLVRLGGARAILCEACVCAFIDLYIFWR